jgi:hypothetical protein
MVGNRTGDGRDAAAIRAADSLADLRAAFGMDSDHHAYLRAKEVWSAAKRREQATDELRDGLPGNCVVVDGTEFHVHGITHAGTREERAFLRDYVSKFLDRGASVYCEQGIRQMYFGDFPSVCEMDDYRWAMNECAELDAKSPLDDIPGLAFGSIREDVTSVASEFQNAVFSLIESGGEVYGERFERALGDVAAGFLTSHEDLAVGDDFESYVLSREASRDPRKLAELQRYYDRTFLPQPLEREWLRRHDPKLELVSHARNERMADFVVYHHETAEEVHVVVGAAHQPGLVYYLERYRDGRELPEEFELF